MRRLFWALVCAASCLPMRAAIVDFEATFDNSDSTAAEGWLGLGNQTNNQNYCWASSVYAGGPDGEAGGFFSHASVVSSYNVPLGATFDLSAAFSATGRVAVIGSGPANVMNNVVSIGFLSRGSAGASAQSSLLGISVQEQDATGLNWRGRCGITLDSGSRIDGTPGVWLMPTNYSGYYTFSFDYNPATGTYGKLTARLWRNGVAFGTNSVTLSSTQRATGASFDAFGLSTGGMSDAYSSNKYFRIYVDSLGGTVQGTPRSCMGMTPEVITGNTGETGKVATIIIPPQMNSTSDAYVLLQSGNPAVVAFSNAPSGSLTLRFARGATNAATVGLSLGSTGNAALLLSNTNGYCVSNAVAVTVTERVVERPLLQARRSGGTVELEWPAALGMRWQLQHKADLPGLTEWTNATNEMVACGSRVRANLDAADPKQFFRLVSSQFGNFVAEGYQRGTIYHSPPQSPGYTSWVGGWNMHDGTLMAMCHQATGPLEGRTNANYDYSGLDLTNVYLASTNGGTNWSVVGLEGFSSFSERPVWGGSHCPLPDGSILRAVDGSQLPSNSVPRRVFLQRSTDGARTWGPPQIPPEPSRGAQYANYIGDFADCLSRIRLLSDGRVMALGVKRYNPNPSTRLYGEPVVMFSYDNGTNWTPQTILLTPAQTNWGAWNEWDAAELPGGDFLLVMRRINPSNSSEQVRYQGRLHRTGDAWVVDQYGPAPFPHSGHPELLTTREGAVLHIATTGAHWTCDGGATWIPLNFAGLASYKSLYYPRAVQRTNGWIHVFAHYGFDDYYGRRDQYVSMDRFRLRED